MNKNERGITLLALVVSIVVLLILAGVSVNAIVGDNGILKQASNSVEAKRDATAEEDVSMAWTSATTEYWTVWSVNSSIKKSDFFTIENLNKYLEGKGKVTQITNNGDGTYSIRYKLNDQGTVYLFKVSMERRCIHYCKIYTRGCRI